MKNNKPETFRLTIETVPNDVPGVNRLRRLLKFLLRSFGFRCILCEDMTPLPKTPVKEPTARRGYNERY